MKNQTIFDDEVKLIDACIEKDMLAWAVFVRKYSDLISIAIHARLKKYGFNLGKYDIEDIRQNVLLGLWDNNKLEAVKNRKNITYWLSIVSGNIAADYLRKRRLLKEDLEKVDELKKTLVSTALDPANEICKNELMEKVNNTVESLPTKERLIIKLNIMHDKGYYEIADILDLPRGTVSNYIKRGRGKIKTRFRPGFR